MKSIDSGAQRGIPVVSGPRKRASAKRVAAVAMLAALEDRRLRREALQNGLQEAVDLLKSRRADLIGDGFIDDYVALNWLEWHGGNLRLTVVGGNVCKQATQA